eukprot:IDg19883t1
MLGGGAGDAAAAAMLRVRYLAFGAECDRPLVERTRRLACAVTLVAGEHDVLVPLAAIHELAGALRAAGNDVHMTVLPGIRQLLRMAVAENGSRCTRLTPSEKWADVWLSKVSTWVYRSLTERTVSVLLRGRCTGHRILPNLRRARDLNSFLLIICACLH